MGRTETFAEVEFGSDQFEGAIVSATILGVSGHRLYAKPVGES